MPELAIIPAMVKFIATIATTKNTPIAKTAGIAGMTTI
jgi:hypothetical protein